LVRRTKTQHTAHHHGAWVEVCYPYHPLDGLQLHIGGEGGDVDRWASGAHLSIEVDDLAERRARLVDAGIAIKPMVVYPGYERFEFRDPFGNRMELITPAPTAALDRSAAQ